MKKVNYTALILASLVVLMFCLVGVAISYSSVFFILLFLFLGFAIMGFGIMLKRKRNE